MAEEKIFYSWQSDLPNKTNRGLIEAALQIAARTIRDDGSIEVEPVIDRDTEGVPGSPEIASTILKKIDEAAAFVCDVSRINAGFKGRATPNPNVLIELGYAMKALGPERVVQVMNLAHGPIEELPFDLRQRRTLTYESHEADDTRVEARKHLAGQLVRALGAILAEPVAVQDLLGEAEAAIRGQTPDRGLAVTEAVADLVSQLEETAPSEPAEGERDDALMSALEVTTRPTAQYARLCSLASQQRDETSLKALLHGLAGVAKHYDPPHRFAGTWFKLRENYFAFLGREWMLLLVGALLRHGRLDLLGGLLEEAIYVDNSRGGSVAYTYLSKYMELLQTRTQRLGLRKLSLVGQLLHDRHGAEPLGVEVGLQDLADADYLLTLRVANPQEGAWDRYPWFPTVALYGNRVPRFLDEARRARRAVELAGALGEPSVEALGERLRACRGVLASCYQDGMPDDPLVDFDIESIGTRK